MHNILKKKGVYRSNSTVAIHCRCPDIETCWKKG